MSRGPDAGTLLRRALDRNARAADCAVAVTATQMTRWACATFTGAQHRLTLDAQDDDGLGEWLATLPEADLPVHGHLVADVTVVSIDRTAGRATLVLEALTVET